MIGVTAVLKVEDINNAGLNPTSKIAAPGRDRMA